MTAKGKLARLARQKRGYGWKNWRKWVAAKLREVGRSPERDSRTDEERAVDGLTFVGAHRRMRGR